MRSLVFSLAFLAVAASAAQAQDITRPIKQARAAVAKADARTVAAQSVVQEPNVPRDSATSSMAAPAPTSDKAGAAVAPPQVAPGKSAPGKAAPTAGKAAPAGKAPPAAGKAPVSATPAGSAATGTTTRTGAAAPVDTAAKTVTVGSSAPRAELRIDREVFAYDAGGRRDPFVSLFSTSDLRPLFSDLLLVVINYDPQRRNSVAIMRDATTKEQYRVRQGQLIGRMRVAAIEQKRVLFTIDEFGFSRQESLVIGDTTKVRKQ